MKKLLLIVFLLITSVALAVSLKSKSVFSQNKYSFPAYTVTNVILVPADVELDPEYPSLVSEAVKKIQARYAEILGGQTFKINKENGDPIVVKSKRTLKDLCKWPEGPPYMVDCSEFTNTKKVLSEEGLPVNFPDIKGQHVFNVFVAGLVLPYLGMAEWREDTDFGFTHMGEAVLRGLKGNTSRYAELLCQATYGTSCTGEIAMRTIAHELGHAFGLLMASRWAVAHPCSVAKPNECRPDLDKKFYPNADEWNYSLMGYGSGGRPLKTIGFNDSCVNPERTLLKHSPFFGGQGYKDLKFDGCLKTASEDIKITSIETVGEAFEGNSITIHTEGLLPEDQDLKVFFPPQDEPAFSVERVDVNKIKATIPTYAISGDILLQATRNGKQIRSIPHPFKIYSPSPRIEKVEPSSAKPGDIVTLYGNLFVYKKEGFNSKPSIVISHISEFIDPVEYDKNHLKFKIPTNISLGQSTIMVSLDLYYNNEIVRSFSSNYAYINVIGSYGIEARIETNQTIIVGEPNQITIWAQSDSTLDAAEIWVEFRGEGGEERCEGDKRVRNFCRIGKAQFTSGIPGQPQKFTIAFTPHRQGLYFLVANVYGSSNLKCSGDFRRPSDWVDCGERSRIYLTASQKETGVGIPSAETVAIAKKQEIRVMYYLENKLENKIILTPEICEITGGDNSCSFLTINNITGSPNLEVSPGTTKAREYTITDILGKPIRTGGQYKITCWVDEIDKDGNYGRVIGKCQDKPARAGDKLEFVFQATNKGLIPTSPKPGVPISRETICSLTASKTFIRGGESIKWEIKNDPPGATAYWRGLNNGISIIPVEVQNYSNTTLWSREYRYIAPGIYTRYVGIQDELGKTVCTTEPIHIYVDREEEKVFIPIFGGKTAPGPTPSAVPDLQTEEVRIIPKVNTKSVVGILVNGQQLGVGGTVFSIHLPDIVVKGATHTVPITVKYSDGSMFSRNITFRYKLAGTQESGEKALPGEECNQTKLGCFATAERKDGAPEWLFCRNMGQSTNNRYEWVTQKFTTDICQGKAGITATCGDGQGGEVTYYCDGNTWVDESVWQRLVKEREEKEKRVQEELARKAQEAQEGVGEHSCSLQALPERINLGQKRDIAWVIQAGFTGLEALWHGTDPNGQEISPVPVLGFNNTNYLSPSFQYNESQVGSYTRFVTIKAGDGRVCTTNTVGVVIEKGGIAENIQNIVGGPKSVSKIILTVPPYGQQRIINPGEPVSFSLPDTGGVPQTISLPITIVFSDGSTTNKVISFKHGGNTCGLSGGKCANANGQTRDGDTCSVYRSDLTGCGRDNVYPYCYTGCTKQSSGTTAPVITPTPTTQPTVVSTPTPINTQNCTSLGYTCADSAGITADKTKKCDLNSYRSDYTGCSQYYYCYTSCSVNQTSTPTPAQPTVQTCPGQCGDSDQKGEGGTSCTGYLGPNYIPCKDNNRYPYCFQSCQ